MLGANRLQLAEDVVQETLITAMEHWATNYIPKSPTAWLVQVAKRKALNQLKHESYEVNTSMPISLDAMEEDATEVYLEGEIEDSQLRMIFTCCHPALSVESQIALTLKTLCGFGVGQVANALLSTESTVNKRLYRAKKSIRESEIPFQIPVGKGLGDRINAVSTTLYLLFNEGYNSSSGSLAIQRELCLEAVRLTKLMLKHFKEHKGLSALLALMCFHTARFEARIDNQGGIVLFEDQDRSKWNAELIAHGVLLLKDAAHDDKLTAYHIEACIAAEHCSASSFETTDWGQIYYYYQLLWQVKPNPIVKLNLAIIQSKLGGLEVSLNMLAALERDKTLANYHLLAATQGVFLMKLGRIEEAMTYLRKALGLNPPPHEKALIERKIEECKIPPAIK